MSGRLSKTKREIILANVLSKTFDAKLKANREKLTEIANMVFLHTYGDFQTIAKKLPAGWVGRTSRVIIDHEYLSFSGWYRGSDFEHSTNQEGHPDNDIKLGKEYYGPYGSYSKDKVAIAKDDKFYDEIKNNALVYKDLNKAYLELKSNVEAILASCTTFKRLEEAWPEYINYMQGMDITYHSSALVPVGAAKKINQLIAANK